jgi:predicted transposase YbfD/YdcC
MCLSIDPHQFSQWFSTIDAWKGLQSISLVRAERRIGEEVSRETRYYIASLPPQAHDILEGTRSHWGIENKVHWVLDVAFREDDSRIRTGYAPENMAVLRHMAVNMLKQDRSVKGGIKNKRLRFAWDDRYREKILRSGLI